MKDLIFKVDGQSQTQARFAANAREFTIVIDEPPALGGDDYAANPVEYLLASYAGCINVVAHLTAKELNITVEKLRIAVNGNINPARLLGISDRERAGFKNISVEFEPVTNASSETISLWIEEIKKRCPVNDNLLSPTPVSFKFKEFNEIVTT